MLGGLNGAHSMCLAEDAASARVLIRLAEEVGDRFLPAFKGRLLPCGSIEMGTGSGSAKPCRFHDQSSNLVLL